MEKKFKITEMAPHAIASKIKQAREKLVWSTAELARRAVVEFYSVDRLEKKEGDPGILTVLKIAEAAKVIDFGGISPGESVLEFTTLLGSKLETAAQMFQDTCESYLAPTLEGPVPTNLFSLYNNKRARARFILSDLEISRAIFKAPAEELMTPLPRDLGAISKAILAKLTPYERKINFDSSESLFWNHIAVGRTVNVSAQRLIHSASAVSKLCGKGTSTKGQTISTEAYLSLARDVFVNHLIIEHRYKAALKQSGLKKLPDFWKIIYDFIHMQRSIDLDEKGIR